MAALPPSPLTALVRVRAQDGGDFAEYLQTTYYIERSTFPRMIVLWKGKRWGGMRSFYTDVPGEASTAATMRGFLERVRDGDEVRPGPPRAARHAPLATRRSPRAALRARREPPLSWVRG